MESEWQSGDIVSRFGGLLDAFRKTPMLLWRYYQSHVVTDIDDHSAVMTLRVTGYSPDFARNLAEAALNSGVRALNVINAEAFANAEHFFKGQIEKDKQRLADDIKKLSSLQNKNRLVDLGVAYKANLDLLNDLFGKLATVNAQISMVKGTAPNSQENQNLELERRSLLAEIDRAEQKISGKTGGLTQISGDFAFLENAIRNDNTILSSDEEQMMRAQQTALQHQYFLEFGGRPTLPVNPTEPHRAMWIGIIFVCTFLAYVIVK